MGGKNLTSNPHKPEMTGQGPSQEIKDDSLLVFGEAGRVMLRNVQKGSPEHHLLAEARVIPQRGGRCQEREEARMRDNSSLRRAQ